MNPLLFKKFAYSARKYGIAALACVYALINKINGKMIIGHSRVTGGRWNRYRGDLKRGYKKNQHLQNSYDKYGPNNFEFMILDFPTEMLTLKMLETYYIKIYKTDNPKYGYNYLGYENNVDAPMAGFKWTDAMKAKQRALNLPPSNTKPYKLVDPDGNTHEGKNLKSLAREKSLKYKPLAAVQKGSKFQYKKWRKFNELDPSQNKAYNEAERKSEIKKKLVVAHRWEMDEGYFIKNGIIYYVKGLTAFAKELGYSRGSFLDLAKRRNGIESLYGWENYTFDPANPPANLIQKFY